MSFLDFISNIISGKIISEMRWLFHPLHIISFLRYRKLKDLHKGQRCFIIGNGPSLKGMDLSPLKNEFTFGLNRIYLLFPEIGFTTSYYVSVNKYVIEQFSKDIERLPMPKFINWYARDKIKFTKDMIFIRDPYDKKTDGEYVFRFAKKSSLKIWEGTTVTYVAIQLAYHLGFSQVILIGVDHNFQTNGTPGKLITSNSNDENHFHPNYFGKGIRWQLPDLMTSEKAYKLAKKQFEESGRQILDATVNGKLEIFNKINYQDIFSTGNIDQ